MDQQTADGAGVDGTDSTVHAVVPPTTAASALADTAIAALKAKAFTNNLHQVLDRNKKMEQEIERLRTQRDELHEKLKRSRKRVETATADAEATKARLDEYRQRLEGAERELAELRPALEREKTTRERLEQAVDELQEGRQKEVNRHVAELAEDLAASMRNEKALSEMLGDVGDRETEMDMVRSAWRDSMASEAEALKMVEACQGDLRLRLLEIAELRERLSEKNEAIAGLEQRLEDEQDATMDLEDRVDRLRDDVTRLAALLSDREATIERLQAQIDAVKTQAKFSDDAETQIQKQGMRIVELEQQVEALRKERDESLYKMAVVQSRFSSDTPLSDDVLERVARMSLLQQSLEEEIADMLVSYAAVSPKKSNEVLEMHRRYKIVTVHKDPSLAAAAAGADAVASGAGMRGHAVGRDGDADDDMLGLDDGSEMGDAYAESVASLPATPRSEVGSASAVGAVGGTTTPRRHPSVRGAGTGAGAGAGGASTISSSAAHSRRQHHRVQSVGSASTVGSNHSSKSTSNSSGESQPRHAQQQARATTSATGSATSAGAPAGHARSASAASTLPSIVENTRIPDDSSDESDGGRGTSGLPRSRLQDSDMSEPQL